MYVELQTWQRFDLDPNFFALVCGKRCIVVGPAAGVVGTGRGHIVDQFDLVCRLNNALPVPPEIAADVGTRCDILYHNENIVDQNPLDAEALAGVRCIASVHNRAYDVERLQTVTPIFVDWVTSHGFPLHIPGYESYMELSAAVGHPNAGTSAIVDLLRHGALVVATLGIDLFATAYYPGYRTTLAPTDVSEARKIVDQWHDQDRQRVYLRTLAASEPRFLPGPDLAKVLR